MEPAQPIDLNLREKLKDKGYRQRFFRAQDSAQIADQLIALRKRRGMNQTQVAELSGTKQPAISRAEQADYQNRKLETLRAIVEALDGRLRVIIEPAEDVLAEYEALDSSYSESDSANQTSPQISEGASQSSEAINTQNKSGWISVIPPTDIGDALPIRAVNTSPPMSVMASNIMQAANLWIFPHV